MDAPTSGKIELDGVDYFAGSGELRARARNKKIGFVFQDFNLEPTYTVYENLELPLIIAGVRRRERKAVISAALAAVNFEGRERSFPPELSGGQQQRVAIARALINEPDIILADEPCGNLDAVNSKMIYGLLEKLKKDRTVVAVSHNPDAVAADLRVVLRDGEVQEIARA